MSPTMADLERARQQVTHEQQRRRYAGDAWAWLGECVSTIDELDPVTPVKPFPVAVCGPCRIYLGHAHRVRCSRCGGATRPMQYLEDLVRDWHTGTPSLKIVVKARRMRLSWTFVALHTWYALQHAHANVFIISEKESKSDELIERARGILARLPAGGGGGRVVEHRSSPPSIRLDNDAQLIGVAEGASQLRQYSASAIMADEMGFWQQPRETYAAMKPTIEGGGRLTIISSAYPGYLRDLVSGEAF